MEFTIHKNNESGENQNKVEDASNNIFEENRDSKPVIVAVMYFIKDSGSNSTMLLRHQLLNINQSPQTDLFYPLSLHCAGWPTIKYENTVRARFRFSLESEVMNGGGFCNLILSSAFLFRISVKFFHC